MSCITTALTWVPQGAAAQFPTRYEFEDQDYERIVKSGRLHLDKAKKDLQEAQKVVDDYSDSAHEAADGIAKLNVGDSHKNGGSDDDLAEYHLDSYDDPTEDSDEEATSMFNNIKSLVYHQPDEADPYITMKDIPEEDEERAELQIMGTDNLILSAKIEDEVAHLEVYLYEDGVDNLYVHHDIMLPDVPLCLEWLDFPIGAQPGDSDRAASYVAIGTMSPDIEIWNLDVVDSIYPDAILGEGGLGGENPETPSGKKTKKKKKRINSKYHVDAVLDLAANRLNRNLLASSSADTTIKLWDLPTQKCAQSYTYHQGKVSSVAWHPRNAPILLSGSYDHSIAVADMRAPKAEPLKAATASDVEGVRWSPDGSDYFYASTEAGMLLYYDIRQLSKNPKPIWSLQAHDESITAFDISPTVAGLVVTGSNDKRVKLWKVQESGPTLTVTRDLQVGKVFATKFAPDADMGFRLSVAGSQGNMQVWDTSTNAAVRHAFAGKTKAANGTGREDRIVAVAADEDEDSEREGELVVIRDGEEGIDEDMDEGEDDWVSEQEEP